MECKKWVGRGPEREELLRNDYKGEIWLHMTGVMTGADIGFIPRVAAQAVRWAGIPMVARSILTRCSKSCDL